MVANSKLLVTIEAKDKASKDLAKIGDSTKSLSEKFQESAGKLTVAGGVITGIFGSIAKSAVESAAKYEQYNVAMANTLGRQDKANKAMAMLEELSAKTPFQLDQITESYIKLANRGFEPTREEMVKLGDIASSQAKSFDQLVEAMLDAQTGEFERLKEFGVRAQVSGDKVAFTFKGVTTEVNNTDESIKKYILSLGELQGVQGGMEKQSQTFNGKMSTLKDTIALTGKSIGDSLLPQLGPLLDKTIAITDKIGAWVKQNPELAAGVVKIGVTLGTLATVAGSVGIALPAITAGFVAMSGPIGLAIIAIGTLIYDLKYIVDHASDIKAALSFGSLSGMDQAMDQAIAKKNAANPLYGLKNVPVKNATPFSISGKRAMGGPVNNGKTYLVGEKGPELFTPGSFGFVSRNEKTRNITNAPTINISLGNVIVSNNRDENYLVELIKKTVTDSIRNLSFSYA